MRISIVDWRLESDERRLIEGCGDRTIEPPISVIVYISHNLPSPTIHNPMSLSHPP